MYRQQSLKTEDDACRRCCRVDGTPGMRQQPRDPFRLWTKPLGYTDHGHSSELHLPLSDGITLSGSSHGELEKVNDGLVTFDVHPGTDNGGHVVVLFTRNKSGPLQPGDIAFTAMQGGAYVSSGGFAHFTIYDGHGHFQPLNKLGDGGLSVPERVTQHGLVASPTQWISVSSPLSGGSLTWTAGRGNPSTGQSIMEMVHIPCHFRPAPLKHFHFLYLKGCGKCHSQTLVLKNVRSLSRVEMLPADGVYMDEA